MRSLILVPCLLMTFTAAADESLTVLKAGPEGGSPRTMLSRYLNAQAAKAFEARRAAVAALKTPDDLARRQRELKGKFLEALGDLPDKTPLKAARRRHHRARGLPPGTGHLREPSRPPRHGPVLPPQGYLHHIDCLLHFRPAFQWLAKLTQPAQLLLQSLPRPIVQHLRPGLSRIASVLTPQAINGPRFCPSFDPLAGRSEKGPFGLLRCTWFDRP